MTAKEANEYLRNHAPLPSELETDIEYLENLSLCLEALSGYQDVELVPLAFDSLPIDGYRFVGQGLSGLFDAQPEELVKTEVLKRLNSDADYIREFAAEVSMSFPDERYLPCFKSILDSEKSNPSLVDFVVASLEVHIDDLQLAKAATILESSYNENPM